MGRRPRALTSMIGAKTGSGTGSLPQPPTRAPKSIPAMAPPPLSTSPFNPMGRMAQLNAPTDDGAGPVTPPRAPRAPKTGFSPPPGKKSRSWRGM